MNAKVSTIHQAEVTLRRTGFADEFLSAIIKNNEFREIVRDLYLNRVILKKLPPRNENKRNSSFTFDDVDIANELLLDLGVAPDLFWKYVAQNYEFARILVFSLFTKKSYVIHSMDEEDITRICQGVEIEMRRPEKTEIIRNLFFRNSQISVKDASGLIITPGLINAHIHLGETAYRYFALPEFQDIAEYIRSTDVISKSNGLIEKKRNIISEYSSLLAMREGTSTLCGGRTREAASRVGLRNVSGYMLMRSEKLKKFYGASMTMLRSECDKCEKSALTYPAIFIHSLKSVDSEKLAEIGILLREFRYKLIIHLSETEDDENYAARTWRKSSVGVLDHYGLLSDDTIIIHGNWINKNDFRIIRNRGASVVHCLTSNMRVSDHAVDLKWLLKNDIKVCIATDGFITNGSLDLLSEARSAYLYHNRFGVGKIGITQIFDLITIKAAEVLGLQKEIGSLEVGKKADILFIDNRDSHISLERIPRDLIFYHEANRVFGLMVDGKTVLWKSRPTSRENRLIDGKFNSLVTSLK
jgi:5-methylthioadenosine/S-adenosylhomocysteine deaminase